MLVCSQRMERNSVAWERTTVINELEQGLELTKQLQDLYSPSSDAEFLLTQRIISSIAKAIDILESPDSQTQADSPRSLSGSNSNRTTSVDPERTTISKNRKMEPKCTDKVYVSVVSSMEGPPDDGKSWRKYGQKEILGAKYPRAYYRCTHKYAQGCMAKKHVQRWEEDPTIFNITYQGTHSCVQDGQIFSAAGEKQPPHHSPPPPPQLLFSFQPDLNVKRVELQSGDIKPTSCSAQSGNPETGGIFSSPTHMDSCFSPSFLSPPTSDSNYLSSHNDTFCDAHLSDIMSPLTAISNPNPSLGDWDFSIDDLFLS